MLGRRCCCWRGSNRRAALAERGREERGAAPIAPRSSAFDAMLRRTRQGRRLSPLAARAGGPLSPVDAVAIVVVGGLLLGWSS